MSMTCLLVEAQSHPGIHIKGTSHARMDQGNVKLNKNLHSPTILLCVFCVPGYE